MKFYLDRSCTGLKRPIIYDTANKTIEVATNKTYWNNKNYNILFDHLKIDEPKQIKFKYRTMINTLKLASSSINWSQLLGKEKVKTHCDNIFYSLQNVAIACNNYYVDILPKRLALFDKLSKFYFDGTLYDSLTYNHSKTVTGRTIITSGINLITLKKEDRKLLQSKYDNGAIIELDLKSIEPRLYLSLIKNIDVDDAYLHIATNILDYKEDKYDRDKIKIAFISSLYGASENKLKALSGLSTSEIRKIKKYLQIDEFKKKIKKEFEEKGYFENAYGRKLYSINAPINYYLQSTAVDYSCLAYNSLLNTLDNEKIDLVCVIVDAIILDVHPKSLEKIMNVKKVLEPIINIEAQLNIERHS